ncbi:MAG: iron-sulfur cluster repair di-iron protein, ric [Erysipelothrix sp.]|nr:iron-sulfur cluster repair di-iron protein, ric [Erysipelothrix sp.]
MEKFNEVLEKNFEKLEQYVPVVARVHGGSHPEFHDVKRVYEGLSLKIQEKDTKNLKEDFSALRDFTNNYTVPSDVCETYEAVYDMLKELDQSYTN